MNNEKDIIDSIVDSTTLNNISVMGATDDKLLNEGDDLACALFDKEFSIDDYDIFFEGDKSCATKDTFDVSIFDGKDGEVDAEYTKNSIVFSDDDLIPSLEHGKICHKEDDDAIIESGLESKCIEFSLDGSIKEPSEKNPVAMVTPRANDERDGVDDMCVTPAIADKHVLKEKSLELVSKNISSMGVEVEKEPKTSPATRDKLAVSLHTGAQSPEFLWTIAPTTKGARTAATLDRQFPTPDTNPT